MRFLVFATDILPVPGLPTSGTALRTFGFVQGLRAQGHEVLVSVPRFALQSGKKRFDPTKFPEPARKPLEELSAFAFDSTNQRSLVEEIAPDCILCGHWPAMMLPLKPSQAVVIDLAGPHLLERHYQQSGEHVGAALAKLSVIATADYYIVSGPAQRRYFLSFILRADVERALERVITVPMPLSPDRPKRSTQRAEDYPHFVFGGVFLPWQDPSWSLRKVSQFLQTREKGKLTLVGGEHPHYAVRTGNYAPLFEELSSASRVERKPLLPFEQFVSELANADVAVDLMGWNLERELAMTIRSTTYLWAGLPVIYNDFADLGLLIRQYDAGWCVRPGDETQFQAVLEEIFSSPDVVRKKSENAQALAKREFSWDRAVIPLLKRLGASITPITQPDIVFDLPEQTPLAASVTRPLRQFFVCRKNGLARVEVRVARTPDARQPRSSIKLFALDAGASTTTDSSSQLLRMNRQVVAEKTFDGDRLHGHDWLAVELEPIGDSAGKTFMVEVAAESNGAAAAELRPCLSRAAPYPLVGTFSGDEALERSALCLRTIVAVSEPQ